MVEDERIGGERQEWRSRTGRQGNQLLFWIRQRSWSGKAGKVKNGWVTSGRERNRRNGEQWTEDFVLAKRGKDRPRRSGWVRTGRKRNGRDRLDWS